MLFNSLEFALFFPIVTILYFILPHRYRPLMLLAASCFFYMAFIPAYILILAALIVIDYLAGILIERSSGPRRRFFLIISILATCLVLSIFKYFNFFNINLSALANFLHWNYPIQMLNLILPIGLSFHTFQSLSYTIEVYRSRQKAENNFLIYALYVMFYPQLVAGPIERPQHLLYQFYEKHYFEYRRVADGLKLMAWGLFKKMVIADRLALFVNQVYGNPRGYQGVSLISATVFFAFQIYCDFSGYSDVAIGAAQVMGFNLMDNFNRPYFAKSIHQFWQRWHISLSTWFRDYLYIPLGGNRVVKWRWRFNIFFTFLISGLWHGANWTYVIWGAMNGFYVLVSAATVNWRAAVSKKLLLDKMPVMHKFLKIIITFSMVCFAWIFFRAVNVTDAVYISTHIFSGVGNFCAALLVNITNIVTRHGHWKHLNLGQEPVDFMISVSLVTFLIFVHFLQRHGSIRHMLSGKSGLVRWAVYYSLLIGILFFKAPMPRQFIYFQF